MQEFIRFLSQGWVGPIIGIAGLALAAVFYLRSRKPSIIAVQSRDVSMIGIGAVFPDDVEVRYRGTPVPRLTSSMVWVWNAGKKTVRGSDIVAHDPLRLHFGGEVLNVRIITVTREVLRITANISEEEAKKGMVCWGFEFLDPGDGGVLEVLHNGSAEAPKYTGTIIGLPEGLRYRQLLGPYTKGERIIMLLILAAAVIAGTAMTLQGILGILEVPLILPETDDSPLSLVVLGLFLFSVGAIILQKLRRRAPSSLDL